MLVIVETKGKSFSFPFDESLNNEGFLLCELQIILLPSSQLVARIKLVHKKKRITRNNDDDFFLSLPLSPLSFFHFLSHSVSYSLKSTPTAAFSSAKVNNVEFLFSSLND